MTLVACPLCTQPVSHLAAECPHCGYTLAPAPPPAPARARTSAGMVLALGAMVGVVAVVGVGVFAALTLPRVRAEEGARELEGIALLRELYTLQRAQREATAAYTANLGDPAADDFLAGWDEPAASAYDLSVSTATGDRLCLEATPRPDAADVRALSMDEGGTLYAASGCAGEPVGGLGDVDLPGDSAAGFLAEEH